MSENIVILMIGVSTFLGALGLIALLWGVKTGQFDDQSKFIDAARFDGEEELRDAVMMEEKKNEQKKKAQKMKSLRNEDKKREEERKKKYMPAD